MSLEGSILGLIALGKSNGYEIKNTFQASVSYCWNASPSQIYASLKSLERRGLVISTLVVQEGRPNKKNYTLTEAGRHALEEWLAQPIKDKFVKDDFLTKIFFSNFTDDRVALRQLDAYIAALQNQLRELAAIREHVTSRPSRSPRARRFQLISLDLRVAGLGGSMEEAVRLRDALASGQWENAFS